jgi:hypothetical protein
VNWEPVVAVGVALIGLGGAWIQRQGVPGDRRRLKSDAEIFGLLPENSDAKERMAAHLRAEVERLASYKGRTKTTIFLGEIAEGLGIFLFFAIPGGALIWLASLWGGLWWIAGGFGVLYVATAFFAALGEYDAERKRRKDEQEQKKEQTDGPTSAGNA